ncbi:LacI family DNA-binding transcriptional regulator [Tabrizicola oligotrophica]|uniref:LacI family transcriptional regulator n=1 Tax=Tabrizicola oligotrophica TaxID=2710650 RepID=A0A6M0QSE5_9RHOB|nr:substrate-binding domain-containing protein [Tabrizicola oligotrophica]NEY90358.1 LacI family transcriptional regulator [Tabrizicola oligotrophica]
MQERPKRGGLAAVAKAAGVSPATVSRAFNLPELVNDAVRARILAVAAEQQYRPDPAARALRSRRTHMIGVALPTLDYSIFARLINRFQSRFAEEGYTTIILTTGFDNRNIHDSVQLLLDRGAEAVLLVGAVEDAKVNEILAETQVPFVTTYSFPKGSAVPAVGFDNGEATQAATEHLLALGHRHFAMIAGLTDGNDRQRDRIAAYRRCLERAGATGADRVVCHGFDMAAGGRALAEIMDHYPDTTAIVCNTDIFAVGAYAECRKRGIRVPDDLSIIGFDDAEYAPLLDPPLTTIAVPADEMGLCAAEALLAALKSKAPPQERCMDTTLTLRGSTAAPRHKS